MKPLQLRNSDIRIQAERVWLDALLSFAPDVRGIILCATPHIESLRDSREHYAADVFREAGFGTLLVSLLTPYEDKHDTDVRYDVSLLTQRLQALLTWIDQQPGLAQLPIGLLASYTVVAAGIRLLVKQPEPRISALVSRAGRADLAGADPLRRLHTPILMQVPGESRELNAPSVQAYAHINGPKQWHEVSNASASFAEPGSLDRVTREACAWFIEHLPARPQPPESAPENPASA